MPSSSLRSLTLLTLSALSLPPRALAEDGSRGAAEVTVAESYADQAFDAYSRKDFARAVALYRQAYDAAPSADILYNIARIYDSGLRDRPLAITYFRRYVSDPGATAERIQVANERLTQLRQAETASEDAAAAEASEESTRISMAPQQAHVDEGPTDRATRLRRAGIATGVAGLASLAAGAGFGVAAKSDSDLAKKYCDGNACTSQRGIDAVNSGEMKATISTAALIGGGLLVGTGVTLFVVGVKRGAAPTESHARIQLSPLASTSRVGAIISGKW